MPKIHLNQIQFYVKRENDEARREHGSAIHYADIIDEIDDGIASPISIYRSAIQLSNMENLQVKVKDDVIELVQSDDCKSMPTHICADLTEKQKEQSTWLLNEFINCFAWDYTDMSGLDRKLVQHKILLKLGFKPYKQLPRQFSNSMRLRLPTMMSSDRTKLLKLYISVTDDTLDYFLAQDDKET
ncbi:hypothetical protein ACH5RR_026121 [Cinchona calisaya]|uniref:Uncharacterized protein n=1 Tax=Cinchona calisaya TaxID=153742 RepID=A0ABD2Z1M1_9GENT